MCSSSFNGLPGNRIEILLCLAVSLSASVSFAQTEIKIVDRNASALHDTSQPYQPQTAAQRELSRQKLLQAFTAAEAELLGDKKVDIANCKKVLRWDELSAEIAINPPNISKLRELTPCLYGTESVLERPALVQLRKTLREYIQSTHIAQIDNFPAAYRWHFDRLSTQLASDRHARDEGVLRRHVAWMHWLDEAPEVAKQATQQASRPNFIVAIRKDLLKPHLDKLNEEVKHTKFASNVIVGAMVTGQVHAMGRNWPELNLEENVPKLRIHYTGTSIAPNSQAVSGPVTVLNQGVTSIQANADIHWNGQKLVASPAVAHCSTKITQLGISVNRPRIFPMFSGGMIDRMVGNVAAQRASAQRGQAEWESSQITQRDVTSRMNARVNKLVTSINSKIDELFSRPVARAGIRPTVQLATNKEYVTVGLTQFDAAQMAADTRPDWKPMEGEAIVCLHQSALTGFTQKLCGGAVWDDSDFSDLQRTVMGIRSAEMKIGDNPRWALQLDWLQPYSMHIDNDGIQITIRASSITYNGKTLTCPIRITAKYTLDPANTTLHCLRQGNVDVACLAGAEGSDAVRKKVAQFLQKKFSGFFQEHVSLDGITVPTGERWDSMATFFVREVQSQPGWLYLAIQRKDSNATRLVKQKLEKVESK